MTTVFFFLLCLCCVRKNPLRNGLDSSRSSIMWSFLFFSWLPCPFQLPKLVWWSCFCIRCDLLVVLYARTQWQTIIIREGRSSSFFALVYPSSVCQVAVDIVRSLAPLTVNAKWPFSRRLFRVLVFNEISSNRGFRRIAKCWSALSPLFLINC